MKLLPNRKLVFIVEMDETNEKGAGYRRIFPFEKGESDTPRKNLRYWTESTGIFFAVSRLGAYKLYKMLLIYKNIVDKYCNLCIILTQLPWKTFMKC
jgi:hypothetical protein